MMVDIFDIAHSDVNDGNLKIAVDKNVLNDSVLKRKTGSTVRVHQKLKHMEERALNRTAMETARKKYL